MAEVNSATRELLSQKEQIYMSLLEKRIAVLEGLLTSSETKAPGPPSNFPIEIKTTGEVSVSGNVHPDGKIEEKTAVNGTKALEDGEDKKPAIEKPEPPRVRYVTSRWDIEKGAKIIADDQAAKPETKPDRPEETWAFTFHTVLNDDNKFDYTSIDVQDLDLKLLLQNNLTHYPGVTFPSGDKDILPFVGPYAPLVHNWDRLEKAVKPEETDSKEKKKTKGDLKLLMDCVKSSRELEEYFKVRDAHLRAKVTSYQFQWTLFAPGSWIYTEPCLDQPQIMEVGSIGSPLDVDRAPKWTVSAWFYDWNGYELEKKSVLIRIDKYAGTKPINSLACYPLEFHEGANARILLSGTTELLSPDVDSPLHIKFPPLDNFRRDRRTILPRKLTDRLLDRGKKFQEYCTAGEGRKAMFKYDGRVLFKGYGVAITDNDNSARSNNSFSDPFDDMWGLGSTRSLRESSADRIRNSPKVLPVNENVIVDFDSYLRYCETNAPIGNLTEYESSEGCNCDTCRKDEDAWSYDFAHGEVVSSEKYMLCPPRVLGYIPRKKVWAQLMVENISEVKSDGDNSFDEELELDKDIKEAIWALVANHESVKHGTQNAKSNGKLRDFTAGKGNGLVLLFHGPPGVGKTLTAELVAKASGKPLFSISVAEIGLRSDTVEANLERHFALAQRWEAVLLIDEADVFLESRESLADNERNTLVSVMLRVLEYYDGILILTTNRVPSFDIAVLSRVHLAVQYDDLTEEQSLSLWKRFLDQIGYPDRKQDRKEINDLVKKDIKKKTTLRLNGRQIRNIISSAQALAKERGGPLEYDDIYKMYELVMTFNDVLKTSVQTQRAKREPGYQP